MSGKVTMFWTNLRGHKVTRDVAFSIDVERFRGTPGYALLVVAANTNLSVADIERYSNRCRGWPGRSQRELDSAAALVVSTAGYGQLKRPHTKR